MLAACDSDSATVDLTAPELAGPVDGSTFQARSFVEFSWSAVEGATLYEVSFEYADFPELNEVVTTIVPLTVYELADIGEVRWRVRAASEDGRGPWSGEQTVISRPTELQGSMQVDLTFSTSGLEVGEEVDLRSEISFHSELLLPAVDFGASQRDIRDILITNFTIEITEPVGTVLDQFSSWRVSVTNAGGEHFILALTDPPPAVPSLSMNVFQRPEDWLVIALDPATVLGMKALVNPRTPKEVSVSWSLTIDFSLFVNR